MIAVVVVDDLYEPIKLINRYYPGKKMRMRCHTCILNMIIGLI